MRRKSQLSLTTGFAVMAVPESGLFAKDGRIITGKGHCLRVEEMILFKRLHDAEEHVRQLEAAWPEGDPTEKNWKFIVLSVLVRERL